MLVWYALGREWPWISGSQGEPLICDFSEIVTEGFTIPETMFSNIYFYEYRCLVERFKLNRSCLIISPSELILMFEMIIT